MNALSNIRWIVVSAMLLASTFTFAIVAGYYYLKWEDERVLFFHLALNDVSCLATNGIDRLAGIKDGQINYFYKELNSTLRHHPGRDYFLQKIRKCVEINADEMRKRGILLDSQIEQYLSITNYPQGCRNYHFDM